MTSNVILARLILCVTLLMPVGVITPVLAAGGGGSSSSDSENSYSEVKSQSYLMKQANAQLNQQNYARAFELLKKEVMLNPDNADGWNLLGFSARKSGDFDTARSAYEKALSIDPKHTRALEYMGEMYLSLKQPEKAQALLERLNKLCMFNCKDRDMLKKAIAEYQKANG